MVDEDDNCNIVRYGSNRCQCKAKYLIEAEIPALKLIFVIYFLVKDIIEESFGRATQFEAIIDLNAVFHVPARDGKTIGRRL